jgi:hypothetical protein
VRVRHGLEPLQKEPRARLDAEPSPVAVRVDVLADDVLENQVRAPERRARYEALLSTVSRTTALTWAADFVARRELRWPATKGERSRSA